MAGFSNIASLFVPSVQGFGVVSNLMRFADDMSGKTQLNQYNTQRQQQDLALHQLQAMQDDAMRRAGEGAAQDRAKIAFDAQAAEDARRAALKRAVARQRVTFGASGIDPNSSGSAQAVLLGLYDESDAERARRESLDNMRYGAIDQGLAQRARTNVLERTHLVQQQQLQQSLSGYNYQKKTFLGRLFGAL